MTEALVGAGLGVTPPWYVSAVELDTTARTLAIKIDFTPGSHFAVPGVPGAHPVHDTVPKRFRHLNCVQHECYLEIRTPQVRLAEGGNRPGGHLHGRRAHRVGPGRLARPRDLTLMPLMAVALAGLHSGYGMGSLRGALRVVGRWLRGEGCPRPEEAWPRLDRYTSRDAVT